MQRVKEVLVYTVMAALVLLFHTHTQHIQSNMTSHNAYKAKYIVPDHTKLNQIHTHTHALTQLKQT